MTAPLLTILFLFLTGYLHLPFNSLELKLTKLKHLVFWKLVSNCSSVFKLYIHMYKKNSSFTEFPLDTMTFPELKPMVVCTPGKRYCLQHTYHLEVGVLYQIDPGHSQSHPDPGLGLCVSPDPFWNLDDLPWHYSDDQNKAHGLCLYHIGHVGLCALWKQRVQGKSYVLFAEIKAERCKSNFRTSIDYGSTFNLWIF